MSGSLDLTGQQIQQTYKRVVQTQDGFLYDGTGSLINDITVPGDLYVDGTLYAENTVTVTQSYYSGSNIFGDELTDTHQFTGSVLITGSLEVNKNFYVTGSRVGIGTSSPAYTLEAVGGNFRFGRSSTVDFDIANTGTGVFLRLSTTSTDSVIQNLGSNDIGFNNNFSRVMTLKSTGNVLIGTTTDAGYKLNVSGSGNFADGLTVTGSGNIIQAAGANPFIRIEDTSAASRSQLYGGLEIYDSTGALGSYFKHVSSANLEIRSTAGDVSIGTFADGGLIYLDGDKVGISTSSPAAKLHVKGLGTTSSTTALLVQNANASSSFQVYDSGVGAFGTDYVDHSYKLNFSTPFNTTTNGIKISNGNGYLTLRVNGDQGFVQTGGLLNLSTNVSTTNLKVSTLNTRDNGRTTVSLFENQSNQYGILSIGTTTRYETTAVTIQAPNAAVTNLLTLRDSLSQPLVNIATTSSLATVVITGSLEVTGSITGDIFLVEHDPPLPATAVKGQIYFTSDGRLYIGI